jgi:hypothetical protein
MTDPVVHIQVDPTNAPSTPFWFGEVAIVAHAFQQYGLLKAIEERVRFVRARMGKYELIDFVAMLIGYAVSGERTMQAFCERVQPFAPAFMALFGRADFPNPATLSRYLAVLDQPCVEALRTLFLEDLLARSPFGTPPGGLWDRLEGRWLLIDVDGTRQAARQRALPATPDLPPAHRRFDRVCAPGHLGRKRGEVVRTRTTILQAHTHQWLGTFGNPGNGQYRNELKLARAVIATYATGLSFPLSHLVIRLDGLYGNAAPLADLLAAQAGEVEGPAVVVRGKDYHLIAQPAIQQRLKLPPDQVTIHPESGASRALYDCGPVQLAPTGPVLRMLLATHPAGSSRPSVGKVREGAVYEQFFTTLPFPAFTASDVLDLYLHRGSFETVLADEDEEQAADRWVSRTQWGQEFWQIISQWLWNLRLEFGQQAQAITMRVTDLAYSRVQQGASSSPEDDPPPDGTPPPSSPGSAPRSTDPSPSLDSSAEPFAPSTTGSAETPQNALDVLAPDVPLQWARPSFTHGFSGSAFTPQPDGTLRCPAGHPLYVQERRPERNGSLRVLYAARIGHCRPCPLREQCQESATTKKPRRVSAVFWPRTSPPDTTSLGGSAPGCALATTGEADRSPASTPAVPAQPVRWGDWPRCQLRRTFVRLLRTQTVLITVQATETLTHVQHSPPLSTRAVRAHWRLSWEERLARNARPPTAPSVEILLHGLPAPFIQSLDLAVKHAA